MASKPYFNAFEPFGYQRSCLDLLYNHDYSLYTPEILLSGSIGSAKSCLCAHWAISHCLRWPGARIAISRQSLPDLRKTIYLEIVEHLSKDFVEGKHYTKRDNTCDIKFANGSEIIAVSFGDKRYSKVRSLKLSGVIIEEGTDFDREFFADGSGFKLLKGRIRRIHNVPENFLIVATNPDDITHPLYDYFIKGAEKHASRYVYYSVTTDNFHLDPVYIDQLKQDYSPLEALRYLEGQWISLAGKGLYSAYDPEKNLIKTPYKVDPSLPVRISFDFNIGEGKPMSCVLFQYRPSDDTIHFFEESVVEGAYTEDIMTDLDERGLLDWSSKLIIHGDATGRSRSPAAKQTNYSVIKEYLEQKQINFETKVPRSNPPIRKRHIKMNAYCLNSLGQVRLFIYPKAETADLGMRLTKLKKGGSYIEDDSKKEQHITTAMGYGLHSSVKSINRKSRTQKL